MFKVVESPISLDELARVVGGPDAGAIATFAGTTRQTNRGRRVVELEYEAYESMAVSEFEKIAAECRERWEVSRIAIVHRIGIVAIGETSVAIAVSAPHRPAALEACRFAIDRLKHVAPIWKIVQLYGGEVWIGSLADCDHAHTAGETTAACSPSAARTRSA
jgi:molybdopterin synthase catalytic subunit